MMLFMKGNDGFKEIAECAGMSEDTEKHTAADSSEYRLAFKIPPSSKVFGKRHRHN